MTIAVDLDGTLAEHNSYVAGKIGEPVPEMLKRVKEWLASGETVVIFTARVEPALGPDIVAEHTTMIEAWCRQHVGIKLPVTAIKRLDFTEIWDDRAVPVIMNTGKVGIKL